MSEANPTLIKRYSNRRLYDTATSRYITLEDLAERVAGGERVRVVDAASEQDLTRRVLLQLLLLEGQGLADLLPEEFLYTVLRLRNPAAVEMFQRYLKMSMEGFQLARTQLEDNLRLFEEQARLTARLMSGFLPFGEQWPDGPPGGRARSGGSGGAGAAGS